MYLYIILYRNIYIDENDYIISMCQLYIQFI